MTEPTTNLADADPVRALIAEDEPLLAQALQAELTDAWPTLNIVASVADGRTAIDRLLTLRPDIAFLDIRMPGATGLEVAQEVAEEWGDPTTDPLPLFVFVTAYGEFAVDAFELAAVDFLLKPVKAARVAQTVQRLQARLAPAQDRSSRRDSPVDEGSTPPARGQPDQPDQLARLAAELGLLLHAASGAGQAANAAPEPLRMIRAGVGDTVRLIPIDEVLLLEAADKYVVVHTASRQDLIRESLRDLLPRLDSRQFVQIHRSSIVNIDQVESAVRSETGKLSLRLRGSEQRPVVSRLYRHLFQAM